MKVQVDVEETQLTNDRGSSQSGVVVTCKRCGKSVEIYGTEMKSIMRGCVMLKENCSYGEKNFYEVPAEYTD